MTHRISLVVAESEPGGVAGVGAGFGGVTAWIVAAAVVVLLGVVAWWIARRG
ncbi:hypothetical protein [Mycolicibacterium poriferae]|uniref:hypothetical protein n=1 Tax=Mycolicibacterium poriferae TaxID=39694 RepID=UPI0024BBC93E|nr:hypothetical protein [Mycolicibacterium poriferae]